jgi:hypothetical protein
LLLAAGLVFIFGGIWFIERGDRTKNRPIIHKRKAFSCI